VDPSHLDFWIPYNDRNMPVMTGGGACIPVAGSSAGLCSPLTQLAI